MLRTLTVIFVASLMTAGIAAAQNPAQKEPEKPAPAQPAKPSEPPAQVNIRLELTVTDQTGPGEPSRKVVTMHVADRTSASIRTTGWVLTKEGRRDVSISVDARPMILSRVGFVQVDLTLAYQPTGASTGETGSQTGLTERINTILESGKPLVVSQAADPISDRRIGVELRATILK
jgi:hypothetical protein